MTNLIDDISHCGGVIGNHPVIVEKPPKAAYPAEPDNLTENETTTAKTVIEEAFMATPFLSDLN